MYKGKFLTTKELSKEANISHTAICQRLRQNWSLEKILTTPIKNKEIIITYNGKTMSITRWSEKLGIKIDTIYARIKYYNWTIERALTEPIRKY